MRGRWAGVVHAAAQAVASPRAMDRPRPRGLPGQATGHEAAAIVETAPQTCSAEECTKHCEELRKEVKKALLDADAMVKNSRKAEASSKAAAEERKVAEKVLGELKEEHAKLEDKAAAVLVSHNELRDNLAEKGQALGATGGSHRGRWRGSAR